jgi:uncharacterized protein YbaR (Trm112 family)
MSLVIHCPTCRHPLTVHESQAGTVVACPTCRHPLTVPAVADAVVPMPAELIAAPSDEAQRRRARYDRQRPSGAALAVLVIVGVAVAVLVGVWQLGRGTVEQADYERAVVLEQLHPTAVDSYRFAQRHGSPKDVSDTMKRVSDIEWEYVSIIARYPRWGKSALKQ